MKNFSILCAMALVATFVITRADAAEVDCASQTKCSGCAGTTGCKWCQGDVQLKGTPVKHVFMGVGVCTASANPCSPNVPESDAFDGIMGLNNHKFGTGNAKGLEVKVVEKTANDCPADDDILAVAAAAENSCEKCFDADATNHQWCQTVLTGKTPVKGGICIEKTQTAKCAAENFNFSNVDEALDSTTAAIPTKDACSIAAGTTETCKEHETCEDCRGVADKRCKWCQGSTKLDDGSKSLDMLLGACVGGDDTCAVDNPEKDTWAGITPYAVEYKVGEETIKLKTDWEETALCPALVYSVAKASENGCENCTKATKIWCSTEVKATDKSVKGGMCMASAVKDKCNNSLWKFSNLHAELKATSKIEECGDDGNAAVGKQVTFASAALTAAVASVLALAA